MSNITTYVQTCMDDFSLRPFSPVDSLILSTAAYLRFPRSVDGVDSWKGRRLQELFRAEEFDGMFHIPWIAEQIRVLFTAMACSPRFRDVLVMGYRELSDPVAEKQFSAVTFRLSPGLYYVAFRGTDSSFVGWKEDFNMTFQCPIPAQAEALHYLEEAAFHCPGALLLGGHSKGGNLAVYAAGSADETLQQRIACVHSHDGPGFLRHVLLQEGFVRIAPRVERFLPQSAVVGLLLEQEKPSRIVKSSRSSVFQHDPFSWEVRDLDFVDSDKLSTGARYADKTLTAWLESLSAQERERFVDTLYGVLNTNDLDTLNDFSSNLHTNLPAVFHAASRLDADTKKFLSRTVRKLVKLSFTTVPEMLPRRLQTEDPE